MKGALAFVLALALIAPALSKEKGAHVAKKEGVVNKKKTKKKRGAYPPRVNPQGEELKIEEMLRDIYE